MNEQEAHDLLIKIGTRQEIMIEQIKCIKTDLGKRECQTHREKIKILEKITWGAVLASILAVVKSFWSSLGMN